MDPAVKASQTRAPAPAAAAGLRRRLSGVLRSPQDGEILRLAVPAFGALVAEPLFLLGDSAIVGRIGTTALGGCCWRSWWSPPSSSPSPGWCSCSMGC